MPAGGHMPGRRASQTREQKPADLTDYVMMSEEAPKPPPPIIKDWYFWGCLFGLLSASGYAAADWIRAYMDLDDVTGVSMSLLASSFFFV
jgi:hypothetical protein